MYKFEDFFFDESVVVLMGLTKMLLILFVIAHWMACLFSAVSKHYEATDPMNWMNQAGIKDGDHFKV